ncbi:MAG: thiamine pyrophosphate-dependent enzyme [Oscillospiraceae bacterium]|nr:thiamine pyrophosphate-dependent enzyme [Oscillospiraceae bacterium]
MDNYYSSEKSIQMLVALMKAHGVKKVIVSPGMKNMGVVASLQCDDYFELYSSVDERSAAYMACGLAAESGEPVALSCTGATASRNYLSGLTEAYYRRLPVLAITSMTHPGEIGQLIPQIIDRRTQMNDIVKLSVQVPAVRCQKDEWANNVMLNNALLELRRDGGGPVHINLETTVSNDFSVKTLPDVRVIRRIGYKDGFPELKAGRVGIFVGAHKKWDKHLTEVVDKFCEKYDAAVFCDQTSNYPGKYRVMPSLILRQHKYNPSIAPITTLIHIGEVSGSYISMACEKVWRVNPDGEVRDTFKKLEYVFEMEEESFFEHYVSVAESESPTPFYDEWSNEYNRLAEKVPDLPFSNLWVAQNTLSKLPKNSTLYLGILNTLRCWNFFERDKSITCYSNTGGFGIDGVLSSMIGSSLAHKDRLYFAVIGDLSFFYDMNALGNRHVGNNVRLMVINNGRGIEFRNYEHPCTMFGEDADKYMAAAGHFGDQSPVLLKHYAEDLGFKYLSANSKEEFSQSVNEFVSDKVTDKPIVFEVFTETEDEAKALETICNFEISTTGQVKGTVKKLLGEKSVEAVKKVFGK